MKISRSFMKKLATVTMLGLAITVLNDRPVQALTQTANLGVTATVIATCTIAAAPVNFGTYDVTVATPTTATGTVTVTCSNGSAVYITLGQGVNPAAGSTAALPVRQMSAGGVDRLGYNLFTVAGGPAEWGDTQASGVSFTGTGVADPHSVFGSIPAGQAVLSGAYTDSVLATVNY
jgi:spore coat protein U-like protein